MSDKHINLIILGIFVYAVFMVVQGFMSFKSTSKSSEAFFNADRGVSPFVLVCTTAISVFSGLSFYGYPSSIYIDGIGFYSGTGGYVAGLLFCVLGYRLWLLGKEYGFQTPTDFLRERYYSEGFGLFVAIILVAFIVPYVALQLVAIGEGIVTTTEGKFPYVLAVAFGTIVVALHIIGGGMNSVAWLDTFHIILGLGTLIILTVYLTVTHFPDGGLVEAANTVANNPELSPILSHPGPRGTFTWKGTLNNALTGAVATVVWPHIFMRTYIAKGKENFRVMSWALPLTYGIIFGMLAILGAIIGPALVGPNFPNPDGIIATLSSNYGSPFIAFVSLLCIFAFAVSTSDSLLLSASSMASRDIYVRYAYDLKNKKIESRNVVKIGRIILLLLMVVVIFITTKRPPAITEFAYKLSSPFFAQILPCTVGGLFWKRGSKEGAWAGTVSGLLITVIFTFFIQPPLGFSALIWALSVNTLLYVGVSLMTKVPDDIVNKYINRIDSIVFSGSEAEEVVSETISNIAN